MINSWNRPILYLVHVLSIAATDHILFKVCKIYVLKVNKWKRSLKNKKSGENLRDKIYKQSELKNEKKQNCKKCKVLRSLQSHACESDGVCDPLYNTVPYAQHSITLQYSGSQYSQYRANISTIRLLPFW